MSPPCGSLWTQTSPSDFHASRIEDAPLPLHSAWLPCHPRQNLRQQKLLACRPVNQCTLTDQFCGRETPQMGHGSPARANQESPPGHTTAGHGRPTRARCRRTDARGADLRLPPGPRIGSAKHASPAIIELSPFRTDWQSVNEHAVGLPNPHCS